MNLSLQSLSSVLVDQSPYYVWVIVGLMVVLFVLFLLAGFKSREVRKLRTQNDILQEVIKTNEAVKARKLQEEMFGKPKPRMEYYGFPKDSDN